MQPNLFDLLGEDNPFKEQKANDYYWTLKDLANVSKNNKKFLVVLLVEEGVRWATN